MQLTAGKKPPVGILYDSDFGASIDTILALAMLHGLETKQEARIAALTISNPDLDAAQLCNVLEKFYLNPNPTIGLMDTGTARRGLCRVVLQKLELTGSVYKLTDTAPPEVLLRNALSAQYDGNAAIVSCGSPANLQRLLAMPGAAALIRAKVRTLVTTTTPPANWPTPVVTVSEDAGIAIPFPAKSIEEDFSYVPTHPVAVAYRSFRTMPYDAPATALAAVLSAIAPVGDPPQKDMIAARYVALASAKPQSRFRRPLAQ